MMNEDQHFSNSSGNVFEDLGFDNPEEELVKAELVHQISRVIHDRNWTQTAAARAMGIDQPKVSALLRGRFGGFSTERLLRFLNALDQDVQIVIMPKPASRAHAQISVSGPPPDNAAPSLT